MRERIEVIIGRFQCVSCGRSTSVFIKKNIFTMMNPRSIWTLVHILWRAFHCPKASLIEFGKRGYFLSIHLLSKQNRESFNMATDVL